MVQMKNVTMVYENSDVAALDNFSLTINEGEFAFLVGPSGSGKTTIIKLLTGEIRPSDGKVIVNGFNMGEMKRRKMPKMRRTLGVIFQDFRLIENMTVYDNVAFAMRVVGASNREIKTRVPHVLELVGLDGREKRLPAELSGGEQQRVAIARALVNKPTMIIADEPTGNLDPVRSLELMLLLEKINEMGTTILVVTHEKELVNAFSKRVIAIDGGHLITEWMGTTVMKLNRYGYLIGEGFRNIFTHGFMSFASVTIIIACLIVMGSFTLLDINVNNIIDDIGNQNQILAYVDESMSAQDATAKLQTKIRAIDNVASVEFVSRTEAREEFMQKYDKSLMEGIDDSVFRHRFVIQLVDLSQMAQTQAAISEIDGIVKVNAPIDYADKFVSVRNVVSVVSLALIVVLVFVSLFIMSNTIKLATFGRREEIAIMKMVGASNSFIRCPFVVEGLVLGLVGGGLAFLAQWGLYTALESKISSSLAISFIQIVPFTELWPFVLAVFLAVGIIVGSFGGTIAIRNYLKV